MVNFLVKLLYTGVHIKGAATIIVNDTSLIDKLQMFTRTLCLGTKLEHSQRLY